MWKTELLSPNKNHKITENTSYLEPCITVSAYLQLTANFASNNLGARDLFCAP